jgi:hypothetical protein
MQPQVEQALADSIKKMRKQGVTALKIELEADMDRSYEDDFDSEERCLEHMFEQVARSTSSNLDWSNNDTDGDEWFEVSNPFPWMDYARFYNDHSVDSELTFTIPLTMEAIGNLPAVLKAFKELPEEWGGGNFNVSGAGMHMAFLFSKDHAYPTLDANYVGRGVRLHANRLKNFKRAMTQLLPALYFLGTTNEQTRSLSYRKPRVSVDLENDRYGDDWGDIPKYSAISYRDGAMEFRIFDTCYDNPTHIFENIIIMGNCAPYLNMAYKSPNIDKISQKIQFGCDNDKTLERLYTTATHLDVMNAGISRIKPSYLTVTELKKQRNFTRTKTALKNMMTKNRKQAELEYAEYQERWRWDVDLQREYYNYNLREKYRGSTDSVVPYIPPEELYEKIKNDLEEKMAQYKEREVSKENFISDTLRRLGRINTGEYELELA